MLHSTKALIILIIFICLTQITAYASPNDQFNVNTEVIYYDKLDSLQNLVVGSRGLQIEHDSGGPLEVLTTYLSTGQVDRLHLVAHGDQSGLYFGNTLIDLATIENSAASLSQWQVQEIMLWSCEVGQNQALTQRLAELTGATVWSSDQRLGHQTSSWSLSSEIPASIDIPFEAERFESWEGELARVSLTEVFKSVDATQGAETSSLPTEAMHSLVNATRISFTSEDPSVVQFSGNNVSGILRYSIDEGQTYTSLNGQVTRLFKSGSVVEGLYFIDTGEDFLSASGETNFAYILVLPTKEGTFVSGNSYGTSSDPVDDDLNDLLLLQPTAADPFITHDDADFQMAVNDSVTYTFTFSTDIDELTFTEADLANVGDAIVTVGAITEPSPGVFNVTITPSTPGSIRMSVIAGADLATPNGFGVDTSLALIDEIADTIIVKECNVDGDCSGGNVCDQVTFTCVQCTQNTDCLNGNVCDPSTLTCVQCLNNNDCDDGIECTTDSCVGNVCQSDNRRLADACGIDDACDGAGACVECVDNLTGAQDAGCLADTAVCDANATAGPTCVICEDDQAAGLTDFGCDVNHPACLATDGIASCVECLETADCSNGVCDPANNTCVECLNDSECPNGACDLTNNTCVECLNDGDCTNGACDLTNNTCVECLNDGDCTNGACNLTNNTCVECLNDGDCTNGACNLTNNTCVECLNDGDCDDGIECTTDSCVGNVCQSDNRRLADACGIDDACDGAGACVECVDNLTGAQDAGCLADTAVCDANATAGPTCVICEDDQAAGLTDFGCDVNHPACLATDGVASCVECLETADCSNGVCDPANNTCVECLNDSECPNGACDLTNNTCVECLNDSECPNGACDLTNNSCVECLNDGDCTNGACNLTNNTCVECLNDGDCTNGACNLTNNTCVECLNDGDCDDGIECTTDSCVGNVCQSDNRRLADACGIDDACDGAGACVECVDNLTGAQDAGCLADTAVCDANATAGPTCVICEDDQAAGLTDFGCDVNHPACLATDGVASCVECLETADCSNGVCDPANNTCVECLNDSECPNGACDLTNNTCVECLNDSECPNGACDLTNNSCVECLNDGDCTNGACNLTNNTCVECLNDGDCTNGACNLTNNTCVECLNDGDCDDGIECTTDSCVGNVCQSDNRRLADACGIDDACDGAGACVECVDNLTGAQDAGCLADTAVCDANATAGPTCVICEDDQAAGLTDFGCDVNHPACLATDGVASCVECLETADCSNGVCDPANNTCVECLNDGDCTNGACDLTNNTCVECLNDGDCTNGACNLTNNTCVECLNDGDCTNGACNLTNNTCVECLNDGDCDDGIECTTDSCVGNVCQSDNRRLADACGIDDACDGAGACVECVDNLTGAQDAGCLADTAVCDANATAGPTCVICEDDQAAGLTDFGCDVNHPACLATDGVASCVECLETADCSNGVCDPANNTCVECLNDSECSNGVCDLTNNTCVQCLNDSDCDDRIECTTDSCLDNTCQAVNRSLADTCGVDDACDGTGACIECVDDQTSAQDAGCTADAPVCDMSSSEGPLCQQCENDQPVGENDFGCDEETPICLITDEEARCVECTRNQECASALCDIEQSVCGAQPVIISDGGGDIAILQMIEGNSEVTTVVAEDEDEGTMLSYTVTGGEDFDLFGQNPETGELVFLQAPNIDAPRDADIDNVYIVVVTVEDGTGGEDSQRLEITVLDDFIDSDNDGIEDRIEEENGSDPNDADSDDDGVIDGQEPNIYEDSDGDGIINVLDPDSDNDMLSDGIELGITEPHPDTDVEEGHFIPDSDPQSTTNPLNPDSDLGGVLDGNEDRNKNGSVDEGEPNPLYAGDDIDTNFDNFSDDTTLSGSGCDQRHSGGINWSLLLLLAIICWPRRWVRRQIRPVHIALLATSLLGGSPLAEAQSINEPNSFALNRYIPALTTKGVLNANSATLPESNWGANFNFGISRNPLGIYDAQSDVFLGAMVYNRVDLNLQSWYRFTESLLIGIDMPIILSQFRKKDNPGVIGDLAPLTATGFGDLQLTSRYKILAQEESGVSAALQLRLSLPTSSGQDYMGETTLTYWPELLISHKHDDVRWLFNFGYHARPEVELGDFQVKDELTSQLGVGWRPQVLQLKRRLDLGTSLAASTAAAEPLGSVNQNYLEGMFTAGWWVTPDLRTSLFYGKGIIRGYGAPDWRFGMHIAYEPGHPKDSDGDGLLDRDDQCPLQPEDPDRFMDEDGCPELDNDEDGILDVSDQCPLDPEDKDQFQDQDGCLDADNDQDGVLDTDDKCPLKPEDKDGFEDQNGCPDPDNDQDGVLDVDDACINIPGVVEHKGCPKPKPKPISEKVKIVAGKIEIIEKVFFKVNRADLLDRSHAILNEVSIVLKSNPKLKVQVEGHTDSSGRARQNQRLSQARAESVKTYLITQGVEASNLTALGFGESKPKDTNCTLQGRGNNRRVDFVIIGGSDQIKQRDTEAKTETLEIRDRREKCSRAQKRTKKTKKTKPAKTAKTTKK